MKKIGRRRKLVAADIPEGNYAVYVAGQNLGIDLHSKGENVRLTDEELAARKDLEWYRIFLVPGMPSRIGRLKNGLETEVS